MQKLRLNSPLFKKCILNYDCISNNFTISNILLVQNHLGENFEILRVAQKTLICNVRYEIC